MTSKSPYIQNYSVKSLLKNWNITEHTVQRLCLGSVHVCLINYTFFPLVLLRLPSNPKWAYLSLFLYIGDTYITTFEHHSLKMEKPQPWHNSFSLPDFPRGCKFHFCKHYSLWALLLELDDLFCILQYLTVLNLLIQKHSGNEFWA